MTCTVNMINLLIHTALPSAKSCDIFRAHLSYSNKKLINLFVLATNLKWKKFINFLVFELRNTLFGILL